MPVTILTTDNYFNDISELIKVYGSFDALRDNGYDVDGFDLNGFNQYGRDKDGFNRKGYGKESLWVGDDEEKECLRL